MFRIERRGNDFRARCIFAVAILSFEDMRDAESEAALAAAFAKGWAQEVTRLPAEGEALASRGKGWFVAYR
jgi:hypothetical protein